MSADIATNAPGRAFTRRSFLKTIGAAALAAPFVTRDLIARPPSSVLRHASFGAAGMAWEDIRQLTRFKQVQLVAVAEVDLRRTVEFKKHFPLARIYQDWRELLDQEAKHLDSVNVSTPDHMHAPIAMSALQLGKHVYCQKPLTHDLYEARKLTEFARWKGVVTQITNNSTEDESPKVNSKGQIVWYYTDDRQLDFYRARLSVDGKSLIYNAAKISG